MVRALQLVLDHDRATRFVLSDEINAERASRLLSVNVDQVEVERAVENIDVFFEPRCQVERLVLPHLSQRDPVDLPNRCWQRGCLLAAR
jgi:hypothetical protein